jgi:Beta-lactamase
MSGPPGNPTTDRAGFDGLGWQVHDDDKGRGRLGHSGGVDLGAATVVTVRPSEELGSAVLTNAAPMGVPEAISASVFDLVRPGTLEQDWGNTFKDAFDALKKPAYGTAVDSLKPPARSSPPLPSEADVGTDDHADVGAVDIVEKDGALWRRMGPTEPSLPLRHWDRDRFIYQPVGEMASGVSGVTVGVGPEGRGMLVVVEPLDTHGQGTFTRVPAKK